MALQDLTPQLRTRLSRVERAVGVFVIVATLLLLAGFAYYIYHTAERKGWFLNKVRYFTFVDSAAGLKVGAPVMMMGFEVGEITEINAEPPEDTLYNVYIEFQIKDPHYGYLWTDSRARVEATDFLGNRHIEVTKGTNGVPTYLFSEKLNVSVKEALAGEKPPALKFADDIYDRSKANRIVHATDWLSRAALVKLSEAGVRTIAVFDPEVKRKLPTCVWVDTEGVYTNITKATKPYWLLARESPALTERLEGLVDKVEMALPSILNLTNQISSVLTNATHAMTNADGLLTATGPAVTSAKELLAKLQPIADDVKVITGNLRDPKGSLGDWLIPTNVNFQLLQTLAAATDTLATAKLTIADTNITLAVYNLTRTLDNIANMTSNLNAQVQTNTNLVSEISDAIIHADGLMQGLKRHWLLRSSFKGTNAPPSKPAPPKSPRR